MKWTLRPWSCGASICVAAFLWAALTVNVGSAQAPNPSPSDVLTDDIVTQVLGMDKDQLKVPEVAAGDADGQAKAERIGKLRTAFADAITAFRAGNADVARSKFEEARKIDSSLSPAAVYLARLCFAVNDQNLVKVGRQFLDQAVDKDPASPEAYMIFGNLALLEGRLADAELHFSRAAELASLPSAPAWTEKQKETFLKNVYGGRVSICEQRQNWSRGLSEVDAWLALDEKDPAALYRKARITFLQDPKAAKNLNDARILFDEAYKFAAEALKGKDELPAVPPTELALIELQTATGNLDKARDEIKLIDGKTAEFTSDKNKKEGSRVYSTLSQWYLGQGEFDKATEYANKATAIDKDSPALKQLTAVLHYFANNYEAAEKDFTAMHQESPQDFFAANYLALTLIEAKGADGKPDPIKQAKAVQVAELSARLNPKSPVALATLAWCYFNTGKLGEAAQIFAAFEQQQNMEISADTAFYMAKTYAALPSAQFPQALSRAKQLLENVVRTGGAFKYRKEAERLFEGMGGIVPPRAAASVPAVPAVTPPAATTGSSEKKPADKPADKPATTTPNDNN